MRVFVAHDIRWASPAMSWNNFFFFFLGQFLHNYINVNLNRTPPRKVDLFEILYVICITLVLGRNGVVDLWLWPVKALTWLNAGDICSNMGEVNWVFYLYSWLLFSLSSPPTTQPDSSISLCSSKFKKLQASFLLFLAPPFENLVRLYTSYFFLFLFF